VNIAPRRSEYLQVTIGQIAAVALGHTVFAASTRPQEVVMSHVPAVTLVAALLAASPAFAAAPANDDFANATLVDAFPYADAEDTREATTEVGEPDFWGWGPGASVWYAVTADADGLLAADTDGSEPSANCFIDPSAGCYDTTLTVLVDDGFGGLAFVATNDDASPGLRTSRVAFPVVAGETYYIQVGNFLGGAGGDLLFSVDTYTPPPPFVLTPKLTAVHSTLRTGEVKLEGTITCSEPGWFSASISLDQTAGRFKTSVYGLASGFCTTGTNTWVGSGFSSGGVIVGRATYVVAAFGTAEETGQGGSALVSGTITAKGHGH
jgi:hypothetical protein